MKRFESSAAAGIDMDVNGIVRVECVALADLLGERIVRVILAAHLGEYAVLGQLIPAGMRNAEVDVLLLQVAALCAGICAAVSYAQKDLVHRLVLLVVMCPYRDRQLAGAVIGRAVDRLAVDHEPGAAAAIEVDGIACTVLVEYDAKLTQRQPLTRHKQQLAILLGDCRALGDRIAHIVVDIAVHLVIGLLAALHQRRIAGDVILPAALPRCAEAEAAACIDAKAEAVSLVALQLAVQKDGADTALVIPEGCVEHILGLLFLRGIPLAHGLSAQLHDADAPDLLRRDLDHAKRIIIDVVTHQSHPPCAYPAAPRHDQSRPP